MSAGESRRPCSCELAKRDAQAVRRESQPRYPGVSFNLAETSPYWPNEQGELLSTCFRFWRRWRRWHCS